jgi:glutamate/tyrosine decarboxylase-like PLP-dependent enzyme
LKALLDSLQAPLEAIKSLAEYLDIQPDMELLHKPHTGIICFRTTPEGFPEEHLDVLQEHIYERIMKEGKRTISVTKLDGRNALRLVAVSPALTSESLIETISEVRTFAHEYHI